MFETEKKNPNIRMQERIDILVPDCIHSGYKESGDTSSHPNPEFTFGPPKINVYPFQNKEKTDKHICFGYDSYDFQTCPQEAYVIALNVVKERLEKIGIKSDVLQPGEVNQHLGSGRDKIEHAQLRVDMADPDVQENLDKFFFKRETAKLRSSAQVETAVDIADKVSVALLAQPANRVQSNESGVVLFGVSKVEPCRAGEKG